MKGDRPKWAFTFTLLALTIAWAVFCVLLVKSIMSNPTSSGVIETAGVTGLLGAMIGWNANVIQYWFRKSPLEVKNNSGITPQTGLKVSGENTDGNNNQVVS